MAPSKNRQLLAPESREREQRTDSSYTFTRLGTNADPARTRGARQKIYAVLLSVAEVTRSAPVKAMGSISASYGSEHQQTLKEVISLSAS